MVNITPEWRNEFESQGKDLVRYDVLVTQYMTPEKRAAARAWLKGKQDDKKRLERVRFWSVLIVALVTLAVAALTLVATSVGL